MKRRICLLLLFSCVFLILNGCAQEPAMPWRDYPSSSSPSSAQAGPSASPTAKPTPAPTPFVFSGKCGNSLEWTLTEAGKLTVFGTGEMYDYACNWDYDGLVGNEELTMEDLVKEEAPWKYAIWKEEEETGKKIEIKEVELQNGMTSIGKGAFFAIRSIDTVTVPESVTAICDQAFGCMSLKTIILPVSLSSLSEDAFLGGNPQKIQYQGSWRQWKALTGAAPGDTVAVAIDDRPDDKTLWQEMIDSGEYREYTDAWTTLPTQYAILDIGGDGTRELIISSDSDAGFSTFAILTLDPDTGEVKPVEFLDMAAQGNSYSNCYNGLRFSKEHNAIVYRSMNTGLVFGQFGYYVLNGNELECVQSVNYDTMTGSGQKTYSLGKGGDSRVLTEEEYQAILEEPEFIAFTPLP